MAEPSPTPLADDADAPDHEPDDADAPDHEPDVAPVEPATGGRPRGEGPSVAMALAAALSVGITAAAAFLSSTDGPSTVTAGPSTYLSPAAAARQGAGAPADEESASTTSTVIVSATAQTFAAGPLLPTTELAATSSSTTSTTTTPTSLLSGPSTTRTSSASTTTTAAPTTTVAPPTTISQPLTISVFNKMTSGMAMVEAPPRALQTVAVNPCYPFAGCSTLPGTAFATGASLVAVCQVDRSAQPGGFVTNGDDASPADDANPGLARSARWYGIRWNQAVGFLSEVWVIAPQRGGLGLPPC